MTQNRTLLSPPQLIVWRLLQTVVFLVGAWIVAMLLVRPELGLTALWNVLVPVAPALLVFAPGLWRNICPLGSTALWMRHMGLSSRRRLSRPAQGWMALGGLALLLLIVPLRHIALDTNGPLTGAVLIGVGLLAMSLGGVFEWKSGWCSGLCPVHPVEKLYGIRPAISISNAHCTQCQRCTAVCPDSTPHMDPLCAPDTIGHWIMGTLLVGGFPGYVWGWFHVSDAVGINAEGIAQAYLTPLLWMMVTLCVYMLLNRTIRPARRELLVRIYAAAAVSCYYWFRLPMLIGLGGYSGEGVLVDLSSMAPEWTPMILRTGTVAIFAWWMVLRTERRRAWTVRPPFAEDALAG